MFINNNQKALLHIAKAQLGLNDYEYKAALSRSAGVTSSKRVESSRFDAVLSEFKALGFVQKNSNGRQQPADSKKRLLWKIFDQLNALSLPPSYADGISKKMCSIDRVEWCSPQQLHKIVSALNYQIRRESAKEAAR